MTFGEPLPVAASLSRPGDHGRSLSKTYGLPGIRVGWLVTRDPELFGRFLAAKEQILISGSLVDETIAVRALERRPTWLPEIRDRIARGVLGHRVVDRRQPAVRVGPAARRRRRLPADPARGRGRPGRGPVLRRAVRAPRDGRRAGPLVRAATYLVPPGLRLADARRAAGRPRRARCRAGRGPRVARQTRYVNSDAYALSAGWPPRCAYSTFDPGPDLPARHEVDEPGHRLPLVDRVRDHPLEPGDEPHRVERPGARDPVRALVVAVVEHDLVGAQVPLEPDGCSRAAGDPGDLRTRLGRRGAAVDPDTRRGRPPASSSTANPAIIPACVDPVTEHTTIVSKNTPRSRSCSASSNAQPANPCPPSGWSDAPAGIGYGFPPRASTSASACFQLSRNAIEKPAWSRRTSAPMSRLMRMLPVRS